MAFLRKDRTIVFESVAEFLNHYDSHIAKHGLYVQSHLNWPMRKMADFLLTIEGREENAKFKAEVVFCGGGNVGLEMDRAQDNKMRVESLVNQLRTAPVLKDDGVVIYSSLKKFREDYASGISSGGLHLESSTKWPLNERRTFTLRIAGFAKELTFRAQAVFSEGGLTSLRLDNDPEARGALERFVTEAHAALPLKPVETTEAEPSQEPNRASPNEIEVFPECRGTVFPLRKAKDLAQFTFIEFDPGKHHDSDLFSLIATISQLEEPVALTLTADKHEHRIQFNEQGRVVAYSGHQADINLLKQLAKNRYIDEAQIDEVISAVNPSNPASELVVEKKIATAKQVAISLGDLLVTVLADLRNSKEISFVLVGSATEAEEGTAFVELLVPWMENALKALPPSEIKPLLASLWKRYPKLTTDPTWKLSQMELGDEEYDFAKSLSGARTLPQALSDFAKKDRDRLMRLAIILKTVGTVVVLNNPGDQEPEDNKPILRKPTKTKKTLKQLLPKGQKKQDKSKIVLELEVEIKKLEEASMFDHLGVHWSVHPSMFEKAMQELHLRYGKDSDLARDSQEAAHLCHKRIDFARRALHYLKSPYKRMEYRKSVVPFAHLKHTSTMLASKAEQASLGKQFAQSIAIMEVAVELNPTPEMKMKLDTLRKRARH
ncbi:MAG: hypothetical protein JRF33_04465 [Deltaproteobacteria bacterium]|nr:hypothetical protein [Deltaproteobacteria bacterium]